MLKFLEDRPWIWIAASFIVMLAAMISVVTIAQKYEPHSVAVEVAP